MKDPYEVPDIPSPEVQYVMPDVTEDEIMSTAKSVGAKLDALELYIVKVEMSPEREATMQDANDPYPADKSSFKFASDFRMYGGAVNTKDGVRYRKKDPKYRLNGRIVHVNRMPAGPDPVKPGLSHPSHH